MFVVYVLRDGERGEDGDVWGQERLEDSFRSWVPNSGGLSIHTYNPIVHSELRLTIAANPIIFLDVRVYIATIHTRFNRSII